MGSLIIGQSWLLSWQLKFVYIAILLVPFISLSEIATLFGTQSAFLDSLFFSGKLAKDILIIFCIFFGLKINYKNHALSNTGKLLIVFISIGSILLSIPFVPTESLAAGLRWGLPVIFLFTLQRVEDHYVNVIAVLLQRLMIGALILQFLQLKYSIGSYGQSVNGLSLRNPGFYLIPSSMAAFSMSTLFFTFASDHSKLRKHFIFALISISIFLTASGTGFVSLFLFSIILLSKERHYYKIFTTSFIATSIGLISLPIITGRDDILSSLVGRVDIFSQNANLLNLLFSTSFGLGTNTLASLRPDLLDSNLVIISDSMLSSSIINTGFLFLFISLIYFFIIPICYRIKIAALYVCTYLPFYFSTVIFELFPINILMFIALAYIDTERRINNLRSNRH